MNDDQRVLNSLNNYYALARILSKDCDKNSTEYELYSVMKALIRGVLNNCFSIALVKNAYYSLELMAKIKGGTVEEVLPNYYDCYKKLKDSYELFDCKHLRKEDPVEEALKPIVCFTEMYSNKDVNADTDVANNRYDCIYDALLKEETFGKVLVKISISEMNIISKMIADLRHVVKDSVFYDAIIGLKNILSEVTISLLFYDYYAVISRFNTYLEMILPMIELTKLEKDYNKMIKRIEIYSDMHFSKKHNMSVAMMAQVELPELLHNHYENIDLFYSNNGFLVTDDGVVPTLSQLKKKYLSKDESEFNKNNMKEILVEMDRLLLVFIKNLGRDEYEPLKQLIEDKKVVFAHMA